VFAAGTPCIDIGPGTYVARLCITAPADGATLRGSVTTTVTVTSVSGTMPAIENVRQYLNRTSSGSTSTLATDYAAPYSLQVPTERFVDGEYRLEAAVEFADGYTNRSGAKPRLIVTLSNGVTTAPHTRGTWTPKTSSASPLNIVAVGDGAGGLPGATAAGNLAQSLNPNLFLYLGDVYNAGSYTEYINYYRPTLGPLDSRTNPVPGNHETGSGFQGYMDYWDMDEHYYSYDSGGWHFIALDSTTQFGQTAAGTAQYNWLSQDLANSNAACTLVFFHHPRFGLGSTSGSTHMQDIWSLMAANGVDVVLAGHEHNYQRWLPMNASGQVVSEGIIQYVVGTGGHELMGFHHSDSRVASRTRTDGVLSLTLGSGGGSSRFKTTSGQTLDETSFNCNDAGGGGTQTPTPTPTPTVTPIPTDTLTVKPVADAKVAADTPDSNYGKVTSMQADQSPLESSYLRFDVQSLTKPAAKATLRLYVRSGTVNAPSVATSTNNTWSETGITWNNKPALGSPIADLGAVADLSWIDYDVTSAITGSGSFTFGLTAQTTDGVSFGTRESTGFEPQLVIVPADGSTEPTPTPTEPTPTPTPTEPTPTPEPGTAIRPEADARVEEANPTSNFGTSTVLRTEGGADPDIETYLRFTVSNVSGTPTGATLRLFVPTNSTAGTVNGPSVYTSTTNTWSESSITWGNRPVRNTTIISDLGATSPGTWVELDVSSVVKGNGTYTFVLATTSADAGDFASREATNAPQLVLTTSSSTTEPTPSPTPSPTPTEPTPTPTGTSTGSMTLEPVADTRVSEAQPTTDYGRDKSLRADNSPQEISYLRFDVQNLSETNPPATLRLFVRDGTTDAPTLVRVSDTGWAETGMTWNSRPATGAVISDLGAVTTGTWIEYDVSGVIPGDGMISFALVSQSSDAMSVNSRENPTERPQLVIGQTTSRTVTTSTPTATATATAAPTVTATVTATATATSTMAPGESITIGPVADAQVLESQPTTNYGKSTSLRADSSPQEMSFLRFDVQNLSETNPPATLRLFVRDGTTDAPALVQVSDNTWSETGITWNTKPQTGAVISDLGAVTTGTWIEYDVSGVIPGNGLISFALVSQSSDALSVQARENSTDQPQLVIGQSASTTSVTASDTESAPAMTSQRTAVEPAPTVAAPTATEAGTPPPADTMITGTITNTGGQDLRCRATASLDGAVIVMLPEGTVVTVRGPQEGDWVPIVCGGQDGYVAAAYITINPTGTDAITATATTIATVEQQTPVATEAVAAPTETTVAEPTATEPEVVEPTPLPVVNGWEDDPNVPWWYVTDDDARTVWSGFVEDQQDLVEFGFDLGGVMPVSHLRWNPTWPLQGNMEIQLSNDGINWYRLTTIDLAQQLPDEWSEIPVNTQARYINLVFTHPDGSGSVGTINEVEIWAETTGTARQINELPLIVPTPVPAPPTDVPVPTEPEVIPTATEEPVVAPTVAPEPTQAPVTEPAEPAPMESSLEQAPEVVPTNEVAPDGG
jgi:hypothetical protein